MQIIIFSTVQQLLSVSEVKEWLHDGSGCGDFPGCGGFPGFVKTSLVIHAILKKVHTFESAKKSMNELNKTPVFEKTLGEFNKNVLCLLKMLLCPVNVIT